jgi:glycosyltransferase involved in cell wall biosynthesis
VEAGNFRLAVDAANLPHDRRGMGRLARGVLQAALEQPSLELSLLRGRPSDGKSLRAEFASARLRGTRSALSRSAYDALWYPWNGMRFRSAAPALVTIHDVFAFTDPHAEAIARKREQAPIRRAAERAARVVAHSMWARAEIVRVLGVAPGKIEVVAPEPSPYWFAAGDDTLPGAIAGRKFVLLVGAGEARKNARTLIRACAETLRGADELLVIAGRLAGDDRELARSLGLNAGEIDAGDELLRALYRKASVVAVPSTAEGFGLVPLEAMACGAPVLAADASALPETTDGGAWLLPPLEPEAWARAIRTLLDDPSAAAALRARGAERSARGERGAYARRVLALLRELPRDATA